MIQKTKKGFRHHVITTMLLFLSHAVIQAEALDAPEDIASIEHNEAEYDTPVHGQTAPGQESRRIRNIIVTGNKFTPKSTILNYVPYQKGERFDSKKTSVLIRNLYYNLKRFRNIKVMGNPLDETTLDLHIEVEEKFPIAEIKVTGNKKLTSKEINEKTKIEEIVAVDPEEIKIISNKINSVYMEKGYNQTKIDAEFSVDQKGYASVNFIITEGPQSIVKQIHFVGNNTISSKELRSVALTKEDWLLSFLDNAGHYHPDKLEGDKHFIEQYYQNSGFLHAKVIDVTVDLDEATQHIILTFEIEEGDRYVIDKINVQGNDILTQEQLLNMIPLWPGMYYSREGITNTIKRLETIWGDYGYIFASIEPSIEPDEDNKTVTLSFFSELGDKIEVNKITIRGNTKTRDKIIRRKLLLNPGDLLTHNKMNISKRNVASLGYFEPRDGVNWKIKRLNKEQADLDLIVKEGKTGHFGAQIGFGGAGAELRSPLSSFSLKGELTDTNLFGSGVHLNLSTMYSKDEQTAMLHIAQPWLFDKPILGAFDLYHKRPVYDEFNHVRTVHEKLTGASLTAGFITQSQRPILHDVNILILGGIENIKYTTQPEALIENPFEREQFQMILNKEFAPGTFGYTTFKVQQDTRNHPVHTMWGHRWKGTTRFAIPSFDSNIGFWKLELDASWYTPLISEYDLVLRLHGYFGLSMPFKNRTIPFGDLFHIGGQSSVRGFLYGQIGPQFSGDTIGGSKALFINAELVVPITSDMNMKAVIFYDGGTGFDNPYVTPASKPFITSNNFDYRHAVGVGIRLLQPMPINIDWGFKIDPRKNRFNPEMNESASEVHFGASYDW